MASGPMRIGLFGGTFDPPHNGHVVVAANAAHQLDLDLTLLVVANEPWQKVGERRVTPAADRLAMVSLVAAELAVGRRIEASDLEVNRGGLTYTADTVAEIDRRHPGAEQWLVVGGDVAHSLHTWRRLDEVRALAGLAVVDRGHRALPLDVLRADGWRVAHVVIPRVDVASHEVRNRLARGEPVDGLVPAPAIRYLRERGLYADVG